ncbi:unnamed protein product [Psylliodes chrysocephalus]|uniref:Proteasome assembly chaperone 2 n=1 Tax=Psylliodes chrysocephalus TaxID=3402493 RepID=A0A9P0CN71_9CUCU|nr:unnamed protein product [Psylliodes chrysocephala]
MASLLQFSKPTDLSGYVLMIPSVSVGNLPQLTIDLLIKTYSFEKIASIWHPAIVSMVGSDPYNSSSSEVCTACEFYSNEKLKIACIQLRSTLDYKLAKKFFDDIYNVIKELQLKKVIILSSAFDYELHNINKERFYFLDNTQNNSFATISNIKQLEMNNNGKYLINGSGFSLNLYDVISRGLKCVLLGKYISEGDNRPDAQSLLEKTFQILDMQKKLKNIEYPSSWAYVFGGPPPIGIY